MGLGMKAPRLGVTGQSTFQSLVTFTTTSAPRTARAPARRSRGVRKIRPLREYKGRMSSTMLPCATTTRAPRRHVATAPPANTRPSPWARSGCSSSSRPATVLFQAERRPSAWGRSACPVLTVGMPSQLSAPAAPKATSVTSCLARSRPPHKAWVAFSTPPAGQRPGSVASTMKVFTAWPVPLRLWRAAPRL